MNKTFKNMDKIVNEFLDNIPEKTPIPICKNCGEEHPEWYEDDFCSSDCWGNYATETFYSD